MIVEFVSVRPTLTIAFSANASLMLMLMLVMVKLVCVLQCVMMWKIQLHMAHNYWKI